MVARSLRYIASGSSSFSPSRNAVVGAVGETSTSACSNAASKSRRDQRAHLLRLAVVGVVVAAGQGVGAEDDPALHLVAEAGVAGGPHDLLGARVVDALGQHPQAVAHGVELGEVAGRLRRQDQVVRRERVHEARAGDLDDLGAGLDHQVDRLLEAGQHAGLVALAAELGDDADPDAGQVAGRALAGGVDQRGQRRVDGGGVERVVAADDLVQQRASRTVRVTGPAWSRQLASATRP